MGINVAAKVSSKNQVTIPRDVRERLRIRPGDIVRFKENDQGQIVLSVVREVERPSDVLDKCLADLDIDAVTLQHLAPKLVAKRVLSRLKA